MRKLTAGYKAVTHDLRSPIQVGAPLWDGTPGYRLPTVALDTSEAECAPGWNYCTELHTALRIAGYWPDGWPSRVWAVKPAADAIRRGDKCRASSLTLVHECSNAEIEQAIWVGAAWAGRYRDRMAESQVAWRRALARPLRDPDVVEMALYAALEARGLDWTVRYYAAAWDAWAARAAWDARDARDARDALTLEYAALNGWVKLDPELLTVGLQDAYLHGLALAVPAELGELGFAMVEDTP